VTVPDGVVVHTVVVVTGAFVGTVAPDVDEDFVDADDVMVVGAVTVVVATGLALAAA